MKRTAKIDWRRTAAELAVAIPRGRLHPAVLAWAKNSPARVGWGVALSGGADSLALLLMLWALWPERRRGLRAMHFNHRLRGRAADTDENFCAQVCATLGVKFVREIAPQPDLIDIGLGVETFGDRGHRKARGVWNYCTHRFASIIFTRYSKIVRPAFFAATEIFLR